MKALITSLQINCFPMNWPDSSHFEVQEYEFGTYLFIIVLLIFVFFKVKKQTYEEFVESNSSEKANYFSYLTNDILMQPRDFEHELKGSTKDFSFYNITWKKYFNK